MIEIDMSQQQDYLDENGDYKIVYSCGCQLTVAKENLDELMLYCLEHKSKYDGFVDKVKEEVAKSV